jgi:hypothetical protein
VLREPQVHETETAPKHIMVRLLKATDKEKILTGGAVADACNPSYLEGRDLENQDSRPARAKS